MADPTRKVKITSIKSKEKRCEIDSTQITRIIQDGKEEGYPDSIAILDSGFIMITSTDRVGIFEVYMQAEAKGSLSPEVLALIIEVDDVYESINWAPMLSESVEIYPILVAG